MSSVHDGHRQRMKKRLLEHGAAAFDDLQLLELLLCYAIPRGDVNPLAHALLERFGSLPAVLNASPEALQAVPGVGETTAALILLCARVARRYVTADLTAGVILDSPSAAGEFLLPFFAGETAECVYLLCLDSKHKLLTCRLMQRGTVNAAAVSVRQLVEAALSGNASAVILAHNHTSGIALPSEADLATTARLYEALASVEIVLQDHIIAADGDFVSLAENGQLPPVRTEDAYA